MLGSDTRSFLTVVRSLGRAGLTVHVACCAAASPARKSRHIKVIHDLPPYSYDAGRWCAALQTLMKREAFDLVAPCDDPTLLPVQNHRSDLAPYGRIALPDDKAFAVVHDKALAYALAVREGIPVPREESVDAGTEPEALVRSLGLPLVLKPRSSFTLEELGVKRRVQTARDLGHLRALLGSLTAGESLGAQEYIRGRGVGVEVLACEGDPLCVFQHERVHEPLEGGGSSYRRSVAPTPDLVEAATRLLRAICYTGVAMVEFKVEPGAKRWALIEINGRFWGSLPLAVAAGADFPRFLYEMLVEGRRSFPSSFRVNLYARNVVADLGWMRANLRADRRDPLLNTRPLAAVVGEVRHLLAGREGWDTLAWDDPWPALAEGADLLRRTQKRLSQRAVLRLNAFPMARVLRRKRLQAALARARTLLFVCKGNICRSPYAERYLAERAPAHVAVHSAGCLPIANRSSPPVAVAVASEFGISLADHRSRRLSEAALGQADVILVFDAENREQIISAFPQFRDRLHELGVLGLGSAIAIEDPFGSDASGFRACYRRLNDLLDRVTQELRQAPSPEGARREQSGERRTAGIHGQDASSEKRDPRRA